MMSGGTTTDAARYLRETSALMWERADAATPDRWDVDSHSELEEGCRCLSCHGPAWAWEVDVIDGPDCRTIGGCGHVMHLNYPDAEHIASWDPPVARAVADLLDKTAERHRVLEVQVPECSERYGVCAGCGKEIDEPEECPDVAAALAIARAYRREVVPCDVVPREAT